MSEQLKQDETTQSQLPEQPKRRKYKVPHQSARQRTLRKLRQRGAFAGDWNASWFGAL